MEREQEHGKNIKPRDKRLRKTEDHHRVNIIAAERIMRQTREARVGGAKGEVEQMIDDEGEQDEAAHYHGARGEGSLDNVFAPVTLGPRGFVINRQPDGVIDVHKDNQKQKGSDDPKEWSEIAQVLGV